MENKGGGSGVYTDRGVMNRFGGQGRHSSCLRKMMGEVWKMRLTMEQRIAAIERDNVVLHDTIDLLHRLLKEHRQLINDYITQQVVASEKRESEAPGVRPEDALYTFVCRQRFDRLSKEVESLRKLIANPRFGSKAG